MVSSCVNVLDVDPSISRQCEARPDVLGNQYTYLHDVPRLANGTLFRNVFCAVCHGFGLDDLMPITLQMHCNNDSVSLEQVIPRTSIFMAPTCPRLNY